MALISATALARLKRLNTANLPDRCDIQRATYSPSTRASGGTVTQTPETVDTDVACRVSTPSEALRLHADQPQSLGRWQVVFRSLADIRQGDTLLVTLASDETLTLRVEGVNGPVSKEMLRKAECVLVNR